MVTSVNGLNLDRVQRFDERRVYTEKQAVKHFLLPELRVGHLRLADGPDRWSSQEAAPMQFSWFTLVTLRVCQFTFQVQLGT